MPTHRPKICFVVAVDITIKYLLLSEMRFFQKKGYNVSVVCSPGKWLEGIKKEGIIVKEITIKRNIISPFSDFVSLVKLFFYFKQQSFDMVLTFTPKPGLLGQLAARMAGVPVIINTIFGFYFHENTPVIKRRFFVFIEKLAAKCSHYMFFRNKEDFMTAKKEGILKNTPAEYIGDGIDITKFNRARFSPKAIEEKKQEINIPFGMPVVGIVARMVKEKGYRELFTAFKEVLVQFPKAVLLVVGPSDRQKKDSMSPDSIKEYGIEKNVLFLGERTDVDELYPLMDMFVLPSYREGFPHSVMEASSMSLPVITTNVRGCRDAVEANVTGIIVPAKDAKALAEAINTLLKDESRAKAMGQKGRQKAERDFDKNVMIEKMSHVIDRLMVK